MGEGGGEALSIFRFHLSPFPQKRLILRLQCTGRSLHAPQLTQQAFPCEIFEKVGTRAKEKNEGEGEAERRKSFLFSLLSPPSHVFLLSLHLSRNNSIAGAHQIQLKTQATFTHTSLLQLSGGESGPVTRTVADPEEGPGGLAPPIFLDQTKKILRPGPP